MWPRHSPLRPAIPPALEEEAPMAQVEPDVLVFVALIGALLLLV